MKPLGARLAGRREQLLPGLGRKPFRHLHRPAECRELVLGPKRFTDLRASLPKLSPNVLVQRLRELEEAAW